MFGKHQKAIIRIVAILCALVFVGGALAGLFFM